MKTISRQSTILWTGIEYQSMEYCLLNITDLGAEAIAVIVGRHNDKLFKVEYGIRTNSQWETVFVDFKSEHSDTRRTIQLESDGKGHWTKNGNVIDLFDGCTDVDISLTPFTNTLPINRLKKQNDKPEKIQVIYIDVLGMKTIPVKQQYTRLSATEYKFENVPNDFEAIIKVDDTNIVSDYPGLFTQTDKKITRYT